MCLSVVAAARDLHFPFASKPWERKRESLSGEDVEVTRAIRNARWNSDGRIVAVTIWRADLRRCNWRCRAMGFANRRERNVGAAESGVGSNLHKAGDTRARVHKARRGVKRKRRKTGGGCAREREGPKKRTELSGAEHCLHFLVTKFLQLPTTRTCAAFVLNDVSTISVTPTTVQYA